MWETLSAMDEKEKGGNPISVKPVNDKSGENVERLGAIPEPKIGIKRNPAAAWVVSSDIKKDFEEELGHKNGVPIRRLYTRLKPMYYLFLCFGVDLSGNKSQGRVILLRFVRYITLLLYLTIAIFHWLQTFLAIRYKFIEYGAALLHLVVSACVTSVIITHCIVNSRLDKLIALMNKFDSINAAIPVKISENKMSFVIYLFSMYFIIGYVIFPVKWVPGGTADYTEDLAVTAHIICNLVLMNHGTVVVIAFGMLWDMAYLSFFIIMARRYYYVFRNSYFVLLLNRPTKYDASLVMQEFRKHHYTVCGVVEEMDEIFSPMILIWFVMLTVCMCSWIRSFDTEAFDGLIPGAVIVGSLGVAFAQFYSLANATSLINDEMNSHLDTVRTMCIREDNPSKSSMDNFQERICHLSYITCILASPVAITGWGFFNISKGFVLTVCSTVLTFTLVLYGV
ncbi:hypothetical protein CHUAL_010886 [Chamberlinius hualienensis]